MRCKPRIGMISAVCALILIACNSKAQAPATVAATVDGTGISESRVELLVKQQTAQGQPDSPELRQRIIDQLATQLLLAKEAAKKGLDKTPDVLDRLDLTQQSVLANAFIQDYLKNTPVSEDALKAEYEKIKGQMTGVEYKARHILVAKESEAKDIIAKLKKNPKTFEALAKEQSKDPGSKANGGDLGWFDPRGMVPEFSEAVAKLAKGKFTDAPVKSQFGYHVILLEDTRQKTAPPFDQVKPNLQQQVQQGNVKQLVDQLRAGAKIEITQAPPPAVQKPKDSKPAEASK